MSERMDPIDIEKPVVRDGQLLCSGCWAVSGIDLSGWQTFNFKHLKQTHICPKCAPGEATRLTKIQEAGL